MSSSSLWDIGSLDKQAIWSVYISFNYAGVLLCALLTLSVARMPASAITSVDVLIAGLCSGCIWMSLTCGSQCLVSVIHGYFYGRALACELEAFFHVSAILVQFGCVTLISLRGYWSLRFRGTSLNSWVMPVSVAKQAVGLVWLVAVGGTFGLGQVSPIYLMSAGTYCFFAFSSPAIAGWMIPMLVIAACIMSWSYVHIYRVGATHDRDRIRIRLAATHAPDDRRHSSLAYSSPSSQSPQRAKTAGNPVGFLVNDIGPSEVVRSLARKVAVRSSLFVLILMVGWAAAIVTALYELINKAQATEPLVTAVGVGGTLHSILVPLAYGFTSSYHQRTFRRCFSCQLARVLRRRPVPTGHGRWHTVLETLPSTPSPVASKRAAIYHKNSLRPPPPSTLRFMQPASPSAPSASSATEGTSELSRNRVAAPFIPVASVTHPISSSFGGRRASSARETRSSNSKGSSLAAPTDHVLPGVVSTPRLLVFRNP